MVGGREEVPSAATTAFAASPAISAAALDAMPVLVNVVDANGEIAAANATWTASPLCARVAARAPNRVATIADLCAAVASTPPAAAEMERELRAVAIGARSTYARDYVVEIDGAERTYHLRAMRMADLGRVLLTHEDVTARVRSERALRDADRLLRTVLRALPVGVTLTDEQGRTVMSNPVARAILGGFQIVSEIGTSVCVVEAESGRPLPPSEWPTMRAIDTGVAVHDQVLRIDSPGARSRIVSFSAMPLPHHPGHGRGAVGVQLDITERAQAEQDLRRNARQQRILLETVIEGIVGFDREGHAAFANPSAEVILARPTERIVGATMAELLGDAVATELLANRGDAIESRFPASDGRTLTCELTLSRVSEEDDSLEGVISIRDVSKRRELQAQIAQSQKLEAIGQLAAGIAHEINTPTQFIGDNLRFLNDSFRDINRLLAAAQAAAGCAGADADAWAEVRSLLSTIDYRYLGEECPLALTQSLDGIERVAKIVYSMKEFAHPDRKEKGAVDLNRIAASATTVCRNEWKYVADLTLDLAPDLPSVQGFTGDLGQVLLNLVVNAAHAIQERGNGRGSIVVRTRAVEGGAELAVVDDGAGISDQVQPRVFEQFFTTKPVGKGTGQGLSLVRRIVVEKHGGRVWFTSKVGVGTTFFVFLPM
jgi:PAS domain S-box-containing protein